MLSQELSDELEQFQALSMKIVFGHKVSYRTVCGKWVNRDDDCPLGEIAQKGVFLQS